MKHIYNFACTIFILLAGFQFSWSQCSINTTSSITCGLTDVGLSVNNPGSYSYSWDFDSNGTIDSVGTSFDYQFPPSSSNQTITVTLYRDNVVCATEDIYVLATPDPSIEAKPGNSTREGNQIRVCSSTPNATLELLNISSTYATNTGYEIDWGDGNVESFTNATFPNTGFISHNYTNYGYFSIRVTVTGPGSCTGTKDYVFYNGSNPSVGLASPGNTVGLCAPATVDFPITNTASNPIGTIYNIYVSGELIASYTQFNVPASFIYTFLESSCGKTTSTGNYENAYDVQIEAVNPCGSTKATIEPIEVSEPPELFIDFGTPQIGCQFEPFTVIDASTNIREVTSGNPSTCSTNLPPSWEITPGLPGVDWIITNGNTFNAEELEIQFLTPGTYTIRMFINSESCGEFSVAEQVEVIAVADADASGSLINGGFPSLADECAPTTGLFTNESTGDSLTFGWNVSPGAGWELPDSVNNGLTSDDLEVLFTEPGAYTISLFASNDCSSDSWDTTIIVAGPPSANFQPIPDFCEEATISFNSGNTNYFNNGGVISSYSWSFPGGTPASSTDAYPTNIYYASPGSYIVTLNVENQCGDFTFQDTFFIQAKGVVNLDPDFTICAADDPVQLNAVPFGGVWSGPGVSSGGLFTPSQQLVGDQMIIYSYLDGGCDLVDTMTVTVVPAPIVDAGNDQEACVDDASFFIPSGTPSGGIWTVDNGGVIQGNNVFDPAASGVGVYTLTYTVTDINGCSNRDDKTIIVHNLPNVEAGPNLTICENPNDIPLSGFNPAGGIWTGIGVTANGVFNASNTPGIGSYQLYYTYVHPTTGCRNTDSLQVTVVPNDVADAGADTAVCLNSGAFLLRGGTPAGGTWSGNGVNSAGYFNPAAAGEGLNVITYTYGSGYCQTEDTRVIEVLPLPQITLPSNQEFCISAPVYDLLATPQGGTWTGTGVNGATFDPAQAGEGTFTITYTYTDPSTQCTETESMVITVHPLPELMVNDTVYCSTPGWVTLPGAWPAGGTWSGPGVSGNAFEPSIAGGVGTYTLVYTYTDANTCSNDTTITVQVIDPAAVDVPEKWTLCVDEDPLLLTPLESPAGGTWRISSPFGYGSWSGPEFDPKTFGVGNFELVYTVGAGNCRVRDTMLIEVRALPVVDAGVNRFVCEDNGVFTLTGFSPIGGTWSGTGISNSTGDFDPALAGPGVYTLFYTFSDTAGCTSADSIILTVHPIPAVDAGPDTLYCAADITVGLPRATPIGGAWSGPGITQASAGLFNPMTAGGEGTYSLVYYYQNPFTGCDDADTIQVEVIAAADVEAGPADTLCMDQGLYQLSGFSPAGGYWAGNGIIDPIAGVFDPQLAGPGNHVLRYTYGNGSCEVYDEKNILVIDLSYIDAGRDQSLCVIDDTLQLEGFNPLGGQWSGPGIIDPIQGLFDPALAGTGSFTLTYTYIDSSSACVAVDQKQVVVHPMERPWFNVDPLVCRTELVQFENLSPTAYRYRWDFGDGATSRLYAPAHRYNNVGNYVITLLAENAFGCTDTITKDIVVTDVPTAYFEADTTEACAGIALGITNMSYGDALTYEWTFGNGSSSMERDPDVIFYENGINDTTYVVTLEVTNLCGTAIYQDVITVRPLPQANIGLAPEGDCSPLTMNFANTTVGSPTDYYWDFGNGNTSTSSIPPSQVYVADDTITTYTVTLIASNKCGVDTAIVDVIVDPADVSSVFAASQRIGCAPLTVDFSNFATPGARVAWEFGDGNLSSEESPTHTFEEEGSYRVIQYASSTCGVDTSSILIEVLPAPEISFTHEVRICLGDVVEFENTTEDRMAGLVWDFGDGDTSRLTNPTHLYGQPGTYTVTLTGVAFDNGCPGQYTSTVRVFGQPEASFEPLVNVGCAPFNASFTAQSQTAGFFIWDFGDGNTGTGATPNHVYLEDGVYIVNLVATDENGCFSDTLTTDIYVKPSPTAGFEYEQTELCQLPAEVTFQNTSEGASAYRWSFSDGETSANNNPVHLFQTADSFFVRLIAVNEYLCEDTINAPLRIYPKPIAEFFVDTDNACAPSPISFLNESSASNDYYWDFGDGATSNEHSPTHIYQEAGLYDVTLIVSVDDVCFDTLELNGAVQVNPTPFANFETNEILTNGISSGTFQFLNLSENAISYSWDFSDGTITDEESPVHRFNENRVMQVYLEATSFYGCVDDTIISLTPDFIGGLFVPNGFSPEQGVGDVRVFKPAGIGLKEYLVEVFSPYGQLLWSSTELDEEGRPMEGWDGTYNGKLLPQDVYVWKVSGIFRNGTSWKGVKQESGAYKNMGSVILLR